MTQKSIRADAVVAILVVAGICAAVLFWEISLLTGQRREIDRNLDQIIPAERANAELLARLEFVSKNQSEIENLWRKISDSQYRVTLTTSQIEPLVDIDVRPQPEIATEERAFFRLYGAKAEFQRILPALAEWENDMVLLQIHTLKLSLPPGRRPLSEDPTYLNLDGRFSLPKP